MNPEVTADELFANTRMRHDELVSLLHKVNDYCVYQDLMYRFYSQSFKVYRIQAATQKIVDALRRLAPEGSTINLYFEEIIRDGAGGVAWEEDHNNHWTQHTRPFMEAFLHARFFLEMAVKYGKDRESWDSSRSGKAVLCSLFHIWVF